MGIEPMRSENSSFLDCRLNHSAKVSVARLFFSAVHSSTPFTRSFASP